MKFTVACLLSCGLMLVSPLLAQPAAPAPATAPSAVVEESLMKGDILYTAPDGWTLKGKNKEDRLAAYMHTDPTATLVVNIDPQQQVLDDSAAAKIGQQLCQNIRNNAGKGGYELIELPKAETNTDGFFLRIHHRFKKGNQTGDQLQLYRVIGRNLVAVATTVFTDSPEQSKPIFEQAAKTLQGVHTAGQGSRIAAIHAPAARPTTRPIVLPQAKIRFSPPAGWTEETNDNPKGIVATYHDPADGANMLVIDVQPLPKEARTDPKLRDALVEQIVNGEQTELKVPGAQPAGPPQPLTDHRFLRKQRTSYESSDAKFQVTSRQLRIGDVVVSVAMLSRQENAAENEKLADDVALTLRALGR
jgi:hypothetical protein